MLSFYLVVFMNMIQVMTNLGMKPVVTLYASSLGYTPAEISMIVAGYAFFPAFLALHLGKWIDKYGTRKLILMGNGLFIVSLIVSVVYPVFISFVLQQALIGIAFTCTLIALQKRIGSLRGHLDLDRAVANFSLFVSVGSMLGPIVSTYLYEHYGFEVCIYVNTLLMCIAFVCEFFVKNVEKQKQNQILEPTDSSKGESIWSLMRNHNLRNAILIGGLVMSNRELFSSYFPLMAEELGVSPTMTGVLLSFSGLTMMMIRFGQTSLVAAFGRARLLTWSMYVSALIYWMTPFTPWIVVLFVLVGMLGAGLGLGQPLSMAAVMEITSPKRHGEVLGVRITVNRVSQFLVPLIFGGIGGLAGVSTVFLASGLMLALAGYLTRPVQPETSKEISN